MGWASITQYYSGRELTRPKGAGHVGLKEIARQPIVPTHHVGPPCRPT